MVGQLGVLDFATTRLGRPNPHCTYSVSIRGSNGLIIESQTPLRDIASAWTQEIIEIGGSLYDDPSLALLFSQLQLKTLQTAKGTSEISGRTEFNFVLQIARVFCRMGM